MTASSNPETSRGTAVITGAAALNGIGYHTARRYARDGWALFLLDLNAEAAQERATELADEFGVATLSVGLDVRDKDAVLESAQALAASELPPVEALANVAGIPSTTDFMEVSLDLWHRVIDVNLTGTFLTCQAFLPDMLERGRGSIVNISSVSAQQGGGVFSKTPYSAAKAGILGLSRSLAREVAHRGVTVNAICPGVVDTGIRDSDTTDELEASLTASIPLGRQGTPEDIASLIVWLSGPESRFITGATHSINGGGYIS